MIYILEDDDSIRKLVTYALQSQGFSAEGFPAPSAFYKAMKKKIPSLLLLDIMLPEEDGISILRKLRADPCTAGLPVIMLTAKSTEYDHVEGLDAGADDYVAKPFGMMELLARVRALLRRTQAGTAAHGASVRGVSGGASGEGPEDIQMRDAKTPDAMGAAGPVRSYGEAVDSAARGRKDSAAVISEYLSSAMPETASAGAAAYAGESAAASRDDVLQYGILRIYPKRYEVYVEEREISLTNKEYQLLLLLVENEGLVLTREILLDRIWDLGSEPENRTLDVHIRKLRSKLGVAAAWIETIRGVGYRFRPS